jgi:hypothetical protein
VDIQEMGFKGNGLSWLRIGTGGGQL